MFGLHSDYVVVCRDETAIDRFKVLAERTFAGLEGSWNVSITYRDTHKVQSENVLCVAAATRYCLAPYIGVCRGVLVLVICRYLKV